MNYRLKFHKRFVEHIEMHKKAGNKVLVKKVETLIVELREHPRSGTGKPEQFKYFSEEIWSRLIDFKHRLVYEIVEDELIVIAISAYGHYDDK
ncbi:MAG: Txe/YoeB family addiction module toxin [Prevotellaceae bacterium]|jgi:toxin YoeB|nr:Txe/YoeB family addiction module toxin [Prevotellaceae bacterium]